MSVGVRLRVFWLARSFFRGGRDGEAPFARATIRRVSSQTGDLIAKPKPSATALIIVSAEDVDATFERARDAGAETTEEPADQEYGERRFGAHDPEGHPWYSSQTIRKVAPDATTAA
ncbi:MAG TPA: VOC family protein [Solirubrobacteraceae bacterium]